MNQSRTGTSVTKLWWMLITHRRGNNFSSCGSLLKIYTIAWEHFLRALLTHVPHLNGDIFLKRISRGAQKYSSTWKGERVSAATGVERQQTTLATIPTTRAHAHKHTDLLTFPWVLGRHHDTITTPSVTRNVLYNNTTGRVLHLRRAVWNTPLSSTHTKMHAHTPR